MFAKHGKIGTFGFPVWEREVHWPANLNSSSANLSTSRYQPKLSKPKPSKKQAELAANRLVAMKVAADKGVVE